MKTKYLLYGFFLLSLISCRKEEDEAISLFNEWTVVSGYDENLRYIIIKPDYTFYFLYEYGYGLRSFDEGLCQVINGQITFYIGFGMTLFNFTIDGRDLTLTNPHMEIICERNGDEPTKQKWVKAMEVHQSMDAPVEGRSDMATMSPSLWYGSGSRAPYKLYRIIPPSVLQELPISNMAIGVDYADLFLWTSNDGTESIYKIHGGTGANLFTSTAMGAWIYGIAWDGQYQWCSSGNENSLYKYNSATNTVVETFELGCMPEGLDFFDNHLYVCVGGVVNKCTIDPLECVEAYNIRNGEISGLAHLGTSCWVAVKLRDEKPQYKICQVSW